MSDYQQDEKEGMDEKEHEKHEKELDKHDEKTVEEKWRRDPVNAVMWAIIFIWAGLVFLADNLGYLNNLPSSKWMVGDLDIIITPIGSMSVVLLGAGVIMLLSVVFRMLVPAYRAPLGGTIFLGAILIGIGLGNMFGPNLVWPFILIAVGLSILLRGLTRRRK